jgi:hypothetical protein
MRLFIGVAFLMIGTAAMAGCGKKSQAKANEPNLFDQMFTELETLAGSLESGDKAGVDSAFEKLISLGHRVRTAKRTSTTDKDLEQQQEKLALLMHTRLVEAMSKAAKGGKFSPADLQGIVLKFKELGESIKPRG